MSQVKKLQSGGSFTIDGIKYDATPEFINALTTHLRNTAGTDAQTLAGLSNALQNGQSLSYDSSSNTISGMDGVWSGITQKQNERRKTGSSNWRKFWEAQFDTDAHRFRNALSAIGSFHYQSPKKEEEETPANLRDISSDKQWFEFTKGEDGKEKWNDSVFNSSLFQRIDDVTSWLKDPEAGRKAYRLGSGYSDAYMQAFQNLYKQNETNWDARIQGVKDRLRAGTYDDADLAFLKNFFITKPVSATEDSGSGSGEDTIKVPEDWAASAGAAATRQGIGIKKGEDGRYYVYGNNPYVNGTYYLKGYDFAQGTPYENGILYNGQFFTENEVFDPNGNAAMQQAVSPFIQAWRNQDASYQDRRAAALQSGVHFYGENQDPFAASVDPTQSYVKDWTKYFRDNGLTGAYHVIDAGNMFTNLGNKRVFSYIDNNDYASRNQYGIDAPKYFVMDENGNVTKYDDLASLQSSTGLETTSDIYGFSPRQIEANPYDYNNNFAIYGTIKAGNQENTIYVDRNGHLYWARKNDKGEDMQPKLIYDVETVKRLLSAGIGDSERINRLYNQVTTPKRKTNAPGIGSTVSAVVGATPGPLGLFGRMSAPILGMMSSGQNSKYAKEQAEALPRFQFGGPIQSVTNKVTSRSTKDAITDVTKSHAIDASEGGLTNAEKTKIAAAVGDLAGVGLSFIPGAGGVLGATTGAASTFARYAAEREMGQTGAGARLATGLALDAASIIPILGTGTKAVKAATSIKAAGEEILKLLAITGAAAPVVTAVKRIANGEKYTSADLAQAISGVASAAVAANITAKQVGNAKLARQQAQRAATEAKTVEVGGYKDTSTSEQLASFVKDNPTEKKAIEAVINTAKNQQGVTLNETQARELLAQQGITFEKGKINFKPFGNKSENRPGFLGRGEGRVGYKEPTVRSEFGYYIRPLARNKVLNSDSNLSIQEIHDAANRLSTGASAYTGTKYSRLLDRAILNQTAYRPWAFGDMFKSNNGYVPVIARGAWTLGGNQYYRLPKVQGRTIDMDAYWDSVMPIVPIGRTQSPYMVDMPLSTARTYGSGVGALEYLGFKKGGKIEKGQSGIKPQGDFDPELQTYLDAQLDYQNKVGDYSKYFNPDGSRKTISAIGKVDNSALLGKAPTIATSTAPDPLKVEANNHISETIAKNREKYSTDWGQFSAEKWIPDLNPVGNVLRAAIASKQSDAQLKNFLDRPQFQHQDLQLNAPRYINSGTGDAYRTQANQLKLFKPTTSDALQNDLMARDRQREALQTELKGNLADSQEFGQHKANLDAFTNDLRMKQYNIADINSQLRWQHAIEDVQAKNANIAEKSKFWDQAGYSLQDWYNRNWQTRGAIESQKAYTNDLAELDKWYNEQMTAHNIKYKDDPNSDAAAQSLASINSQLALKKNNLGNSGYVAQLSPFFQRWFGYKNLKKGGKVESGKRSAMTYSRDPYPELLLQNAKDSTEIVKQLNDAVIKLLLQTKPINVH